ncbi:MAG TPA: SPFH domain-containing protein [Gemmataceae bacterium]|jgi:regulator of protease activity HflC (stomatin/prohibitin superfamily)|nr:SPFH domain-containing protein [Gemmataceae bacterium]
MAASSSDFRSLLGAGFWLAALAAVASAWYSVVADSYVALALALELVLVAFASWAVRNLQYKRQWAESAKNPAPGNPQAEAAVPVITDLPGKAVQTQKIVLATVAVLVGLTALFQLLQEALDAGVREGGSAAFGAVCLAFAFVWLVLGRSLQAVSATDLPEAEQLGFAFREAQWASLAAAAGLMATMLYPPLVVWTSRALFAWVLASCIETLVRRIAPILIPQGPGRSDVAPIQLMLREIVFSRGNPLGSMLRTLETRYGVSMRSTWAITFVEGAIIPLLILLILLYWGSTAVVIVEMGQLGARESFGRVSGEPLMPGLHFKLPWPCGLIRTFPVKTVRQLPIGFVEEEQPVNLKEPRALLWTRGHAKEEFALVLGGGTELVVVNALLYYKIAEDPRGFMDYVYRQSAQEDALAAFAYRALMEETRGRTLDEVLSADRSAFSSSLADSVRRQAREARLGLEVVDLALINLHPPIEAAGSYLDVINARLDAHRQVIDAEGKKQVAILTSQTAGITTIANAQIEGSRRVAAAASLAAEFSALSQAYQVGPQTFRKRLWIEAQETALTGQRLFLIDSTLLGQGGELLLDTRRNPVTTVPNLDVMPSPAPSGVKNRE